MRGLQKQAFQTIVLVAFLTLGMGLSSWYGLHQTLITLNDFETKTLPEMSTALNLSEGVALLAALAPYVAGSAKPFQLQIERDRLEARFIDMKKVAASLKNMVFRDDLEFRLAKFRKALSELIERIEEELFLQEDLLAAQFTLAELKRHEHSAHVQSAIVPLNIFTALEFKLDLSDQPSASQELPLNAMFQRLKADGYNPAIVEKIEDLVAKITAAHTRIRAIEHRKSFLLASLRAQSDQLAEQVKIFTGQLQRQVVNQRERVQSAVFDAHALMVVIAGLLMWGMLIHYRFNFRMTRDLSLVTQDMLRLAETGDTQKKQIGIQREDEIGELARAYNVFRDYAITNKTFSERLTRQKVLLETVFNQITDGLSVFSSDRKLVSWNKRFVEIFNLAPDEIRVGQNLDELRMLMKKEPHENRTMTNDPLDLDKADPVRSNSPLTFERRYHSGKVVEFRSQPMPDGGFVTLYGDLTERKKVEAQLHQAQKMEMLGQLTGGVAHDFNNLLAALLTNLQLLNSTAGLSAKQRRYLDRSLSVTEKGVHLIERLLAFSRKQQLFPEVLDVNDLISGMLDLVEYSLAPGITITTDFRAHECVFVDPSQLENAILNLAVNSSDAMPEGGDLTLYTDRHCLSDACQEYIAVIVEDTGLGIPEEMQARVLEPFFTTKPAGQGSGMGLSMVYGFVKQSGGEMQIKSALGQGTRITLLLPVARQGQTIDYRKDAQSVDPVSIPAGKKILIVEDNDAVRQAIAEQIESFGHETITAARAETALDLLSRQSADVALVITDISLGGSLSGLDLKRSVNKSLPEISVVLTSGLPRQSLTQHYGLQPEDQVLPKPIPYPTLKHLLDG